MSHGQQGDGNQAHAGNHAESIPTFALGWEPPRAASSPEVVPLPTPAPPRAAAPEVVPLPTRAAEVVADDDPDLEAAGYERILASIHNGTKQIGIERVQPVNLAGYLETVDLDQAGGLAELLEHVRRTHGGGKYRLRPFKSSGGFDRGSTTIRIAGAPDRKSVV